MSATRKFMQVMLMFMGVVALALVSAVVTMKVITWGKTVRVPGVIGIDVTSAITRLKESGLDIKVEREEHHPTVPAGSIIDQDPKPGQAVKTGRNVSVVVSLGSEEVTVPGLAGEIFRRAQIELKQAGLTLGEVAHVYSQAPREAVLVQDPPGQSVMQKGSSVSLLVSAGPRPARFITPDLSGMTLAQIGESLKGLPLRVFSYGAGVVVSQEPRAGYPAAAGGDIRLTLGRPPVPPAQPAPPVKNDKGGA